MLHRMLRPFTGLLRRAGSSWVGELVLDQQTRRVELRRFRWLRVLGKLSARWRPFTEEHVAVLVGPVQPQRHAIRLTIARVLASCNIGTVHADIDVLET